MKRIFSILLSLVMLVGIFTSMPLSVAAASDYLSYEFYADDEVYFVVGCNENATGEVVIPETYNGYPVTEILDGAFSFCSDVTSIVIPSSVKQIAESAFYQCDGLVELVIPDSVVYMGKDACYDCDNLKTVVIGSELNAIHNNTFYSCDALESITIGNNVTRIGREAFFACKALTSIVIPVSVTRIEDNAFNYCLSLTSVKFNNGLEYIGYKAFYGCEALTCVVFPYSVQEIDTECFYCCKEISSVTIYNDKMSVGEFAIGYWEDDDGCLSTVDNLTVCGNAGSIAERFANSKGFTFVVDNHTHELTDWIVKESATCTTNGLKVKVCTICGAPCETAEIEMLGHDYSTEWLIDWVPEENYDGRKSRRCANCGDRIDPIVIPAFGKNFTETFHSEIMTLWFTVGFSSQSDNIYEFSARHIKWYTNYQLDMDQFHAYDEEYEYEYDGQIYTYIISYYAVPAEIYEAQALKHFNIADINILRNDTGSEPQYNAETNSYVMSSAGGFGDSITYHTKGYINHLDGTYEVYGYTVDLAYEKPAGAVEGVDYIIRNGYPAEIVKCHRITIEFNGTDVKFISWENIDLEEMPSIKDLVHEHIASSWITDKAATCKAAGSRHKECTVCKAVLQTEAIAKKAHTPSGWKTDKAATASAAGSKHKECTVCKTVLETAKIAQLKAGKPKLSKIENTADGVKITWGKVSGADTYEVYRKTKGGKYKKIGTTSKNYYTDKKATSGKTYYYAVKSVNEVGKSDYSGSLSKLYLADPTLKTPKSAKKGITLNWSKVSGAEGYVIYYKTGSGSYKKLTTVKGGKKVTYTHTKAKKGKTYTYKVKAYKSKTYSAYSNAKKIKDKY